MNRETILDLIDLVTHPVNMTHQDAVEFLDTLVSDLNKRIVSTLRDAILQDKRIKDSEDQ